MKPLNTIVIAFFFALISIACLFTGCSLIAPTLDKATAETVLRYCATTPAESRAYVRSELASSCFRAAGKACGVAVRCPGEEWADVIPTNTAPGGPLE